MFPRIQRTLLPSRPPENWDSCIGAADAGPLPNRYFNGAAMGLDTGAGCVIELTAGGLASVNLGPKARSFSAKLDPFGW